jgi:hypothetical protein
VPTASPVLQAGHNGRRVAGVRYKKCQHPGCRERGSHPWMGIIAPPGHLASRARFVFCGEHGDYYSTHQLDPSALDPPQLIEDKRNG